MSIIKIETKTSLYQRLDYQFGLLIVLELAFLLCLFLTHFSQLAKILMQTVLILFFILHMFSKYSIPITRIELNYESKKISIKTASFFGCKLIEIPFSQVKFKFKWKFLFNYYKPVIIIGNNNKNLIVFPLHNTLWDRSEVDMLLKEIVRLSQESLDKKQLFIAENFYNFLPTSIIKTLKKPK